MLNSEGKDGSKVATWFDKSSLRTSQSVLSQEEWKFDTLCDIFDSVAITQAVIFCALAAVAFYASTINRLCCCQGNNRKKVDWLAKKMREANFPIAAIHGDLPQKENNWTLTLFQPKFQFSIELNSWMLFKYVQIKNNQFNHSSTIVQPNHLILSWHIKSKQDRDTVMEAFRDGRSRHNSGQFQKDSKGHPRSSFGLFGFWRCHWQLVLGVLNKSWSCKNRGRQLIATDLIGRGLDVQQVKHSDVEADSPMQKKAKHWQQILHVIDQ